MTVKMAATVINDGEDLRHSEQIGSVTQHLDDLMDFATDRSDGINTAVTILMDGDGCLDYYIYRLLREINDMHDDLWLFKITFTQITMLYACNNPCVSKELKSMMRPTLMYDTKLSLEDVVGACASKRDSKLCST
jgi:hypothetical protein